VAAFAVLSIGGESAARRADLPNHVLLVIVALVLGLLALVDHLAARRAARREER
jgi:simple sugar transport system permease protein